MTAREVDLRISEESDASMIAHSESATLWAEHLKAAPLLRIALWFALLAGLGEVALLAVAKYFLNRYIDYLGQHSVWMAPLADAILFAIPGLLLLLLAWRWPRLVTMRVAVFIYAFLALVSWLLLYQRLHIYAALVLAAGLATQAARLASTRVDWFYRLVRRSTVWLVALVLALALGMSGFRWIGERRAVAMLPAAEPGAPNVLFIVLDTVRAHNLSLYGYPRSTTPRLEQLGRSGVVFNRAISTAPWTLPSHASMFTGRYPHELSTGYASALDTAHPTLAEVLRSAGYLTAGFVANTWYCGRMSGLNRGFDHYEDLAISPGQIMISSSLVRTANSNEWLRRKVYVEMPGRKSAPEVNGRFLRWLSERDSGRPFFAFLNFFDAHEPYLPPPPFDTKFGHAQPRVNPRHDLDWRWAPSDIQTEMNAYDGSIAYLDYNIGLLLDQLDERGLLDNTLIIITSDHGEEFGEHSVMDHGYSVYMPVLHVPLVISFPKRVPAGISIREPVSLRDLPATVVDLINVAKGAGFPGASLKRYWNGGTAANTYSISPSLSEVDATDGLPEWYPLSAGEMKSLITERYHYIRNGNGLEELYDYTSDPLEQNNLASIEGGRKMLDQLRTYLDSVLSGAYQVMKR
jgi:arylsulfatase A-like enzyme